MAPKISENLGKILEILGKIPENPNKTLNYLKQHPWKSGQKWRPTFEEKQVKTIFWRSHQKNGPQELEDNFLGKFGKIWAKIHCTPKNLLAPTPMHSHLAPHSNLVIKPPLPPLLRPW